jgi:hypothetical protein
VAAGGQAFGAKAGLRKALAIDAHATDAAEAVVAIRLALGM